MKWITEWESEWIYTALQVGIAGVQCDAVMKRTKAIEDNWSPVWNEEFVFPLCVPELALLIIEVHEYDMSEKDDFGGQICLPVWELRPGIRTVRLCDRKGDQMNSVKLLMRFEFIWWSVSFIWGLFYGKLMSEACVMYYAMLILSNFFFMDVFL